jgi:hypothetical protein
MFCVTIQTQIDKVGTVFRYSQTCPRYTNPLAIQILVQFKQPLNSMESEKCKGLQQWYVIDSEVWIDIQMQGSAKYLPHSRPVPMYPEL